MTCGVHLSDQQQQLLPGGRLQLLLVERAVVVRIGRLEQLLDLGVVFGRCRACRRCRDRPLSARLRRDAPDSSLASSVPSLSGSSFLNIAAPAACASLRSTVPSASGSSTFISAASTATSATADCESTTPAPISRPSARSVLGNIGNLRFRLFSLSRNWKYRAHASGSTAPLRLGERAVTSEWSMLRKLKRKTSLRASAIGCGFFSGERGDAARRDLLPAAAHHPQRHWDRRARAARPSPSASDSR